VVLLSNFGLGLDYVLMALAPDLWWLFAGRLISGITSASFGAAYAYVADVTPAEHRAGRFGLLGAAFGLGFVLGPAAGGVLGSVDLRLPFWVAASLSLANFLYGWLVLPESLPRERRAKFSLRRASPLGALRLLASQPRLRGLSLLTFVQLLAHGSLPGVFVLYADYRYGWGPDEVGGTLALVGVLSMLVSGLLVRRFVALWGEQRTLLVGLAASAVGLLGYGLAPTGIWFLCAVPVSSLWGLVGPSIQGQMSRAVSSSEQGRLQGAMSSLKALAGVTSPVLFTQVFALAVAEQARGVGAGAPYLLAACLLGACLLGALRLFQRDGS
jgi:DHA1 family tetracycline resistance protein-like MFS transporter